MHGPIALARNRGLLHVLDSVSPVLELSGMKGSGLGVYGPALSI